MSETKLYSLNKIVIDHGSFSCKFGYAGYDKPMGMIRTTVAHDKINNKYDVGLKESMTIVNKYNNIIYPIKNGIIQDFEIMKKIWDCIFYNHMKIEPKKCKLLMSMANISDKTNFHKIIKIMINHYNFRGVQIYDQQILSLYGVGKNMGLVVDIGHNLTRIVPIYDSIILHKAVKYSCLAGSSINKYINMASNENFVDDILNKAKKRIFKKNYRNEEYIFVNKKKINNSSWDDILLNPKLLNYDCDNLVELISDSIKNCPIDIKKVIMTNIILIGGTSAIPGLCKKINAELKKYDKTIRVYGHKNRHISSWIGGSILSCLPTFDNMWIEK